MESSVNIEKERKKVLEETLKESEGRIKEKLRELGLDQADIDILSLLQQETFAFFYSSNNYEGKQIFEEYLGLKNLRVLDIHTLEKVLLLYPFAQYLKISNREETLSFFPYNNYPRGEKIQYSWLVKLMSMFYEVIPDMYFDFEVLGELLKSDEETRLKFPTISTVYELLETIDIYYSARMELASNSLDSASPSNDIIISEHINPNYSERFLDRLSRELREFFSVVQNRIFLAYISEDVRGEIKPKEINLVENFKKFIDALQI